tara:strand:- start:280 stop:621 length:342 start_codon:yes stop_codon:yes gene_type:complete
MTVKMINENYHNNSTLSCFISFTLLVVMKLYNSVTVAYNSVKSDKMMSAYMSEFVSYNVLDSDYVQEKYGGNKNNKLEDITDLENDDFKDVNETEEKDKSVNVEEIIPIISKV